MAIYWIFRIAATIVPRIPIRVSRPLALALGLALWALAPGLRRRAERNLRHIPTLATNPQRLARATQEAFQNTALNYLDFLRGRALGDAEIQAGWTVERQEVFDEAMAQGRGLIIVSGHFGNFEFASSRLGALGYSMVTPAEHMRPEALFQLFCRLREHHNMRIIPADSRESLREIHDELKAGHIVIFLVDRYVLGASVETSLFGAPAPLPIAPFQLALRAGVPVLAPFSWRLGPGRYHGVFYPVTMGAAQTGQRARPTLADAERLQRDFLDIFERVVAEHPEQWVSTLSHIWDAETPPASDGGGARGVSAPTPAEPREAGAAQSPKALTPH